MVTLRFASKYVPVSTYQKSSRCRGDERQGMTDRFEGVLKLLEGDSNEEKVRAPRAAVTP